MDKQDSGKKELLHHKDTTIGLFATDKYPEQLIEAFWKREDGAAELGSSQRDIINDVLIDLFNKYLFRITKNDRNQL